MATLDKSKLTALADIAVTHTEKPDTITEMDSAARGS
jgi:hypothetical protein